MPLSESAQVALGILQTVGLVIPVIFLTARQFLGNRSPRQGRKPQYDADDEIEARDVAPGPVRLAWFALAMLVTAAGVAALRVAWDMKEDPIIVISLSLLVFSFLVLALIFYRIRRSFVEYLI